MVMRRFLPEIDPADPNQRWRKYGLFASFLGSAILICLVGSLSYYDRATIVLYSAAVPCTILLTVTALSCWFNYHVKSVLTCVLLSIYGIIWGFGYIEIVFLEIQIHALALYMFLPLVMVSIMNHKVAFVLVPIQSGLVFHATTIYMQQFYSAGYVTTQNMYYVAGVSATMSGLSFLMTGMVNMIREYSDRNLLKVIEVNKALAHTDHLTGLSNRRAFFDLQNALWQEGEPFVIAYLDLLRFKPVNDQYGHAAGDAILKELSARMLEFEQVRSAARMGGDEFAIVLTKGVCGEKAEQVIAKLHALLTEDIITEHGVLSVGISIGYVEAFKDVTVLSLLTAAADTAMRRARSKNVPAIRFNSEIDEATLTTSAIEVEFKNALKTGKIRAAVQPIGSARTQQIVGYELLSRWTNSGFEQDPRPDRFIPVAEKLGLLNELLWVTLEETLARLDLRDRKLSVNVSPGQLASTDFLVRLMSILNRHKVSPASLTLEVTEQIAFRNLARNVDVLEQARALGLSIALDDFGTGYASLSIVDALPLDKVKIDRSFLRSPGVASKGDAVLDAAIQMCRRLDLICCVEGVETQDAADVIASLGADEIQGYLLGRPCLVSDMSRVTMVA